MRRYLGVAKKAGITEEEIGAVQSIVMAVHAGRVRAQLREARPEIGPSDVVQEVPDGAA